jgi:hypothetical protein
MDNFPAFSNKFGREGREAAKVRTQKGGEANAKWCSRCSQCRANAKDGANVRYRNEKSPEWGFLSVMGDE